MDIISIKKIIKENKKFLENKYLVKEIGIFGSFVRDEQKTKSDIDILVIFKKPIGFVKFIRLENYLSSLFEKKVDLVTKNALKPYIGSLILQEIQYV